jgi:hypothetical protein
MALLAENFSDVYLKTKLCITLIYLLVFYLCALIFLHLYGILRGYCE